MQLINPCNAEYPVSFISPGPHVDTWIRNLSRYKDLREIKEQIKADGGIAWSRKMLNEICTTSNIRDALDNMFLLPWIKKAEKVHAMAVDLHYEIESYDEVAEVKERMRKAILNDTYQSLRHFFDREFQYSEDGMIQEHETFWTSIFTQYLDQFLADTPKSQAISEVLWENLKKRLDPDNKGFLSARENDLPHIIHKHGGILCAQHDGAR